MVRGHDVWRAPSAVIVELKQRSPCKEGGSENLASTWVGGAHRDVLAVTTAYRARHTPLLRVVSCDEQLSR